MRFAAAFLATTASSFLFGFSFPPFGMSALAWVCVAPLFVALRSVGLGAALFLAWYWAVLAAWRIADALPASISSYFLQPRLVGWAIAIGVWSTMAAPYYMAFTPVYRIVARRRGAMLPLLVAAAWTAAELARGRLFTGTPFFIGNPWGLLGYTQVRSETFVQMASVTGVYGLGFAVVAVNAAVAQLAVELRRGGRARGHAWWGLGVAMLPAAVIFAFGRLALRVADPAGGAPSAVAIVQGNVTTGSRWRSDLYGKNLDVYLRASLEAFAQGRPAIVFWPESAFTFFLEDEPLYREAIARVLVRAGAELVAGGVRQEGSEEDPRFFNSIFLLSPLGEIRGRYDKEYLVPFTEYLPASRLDFLRRRFGRIRVLESGLAGTPLDTQLGPAGILVCNEAMLPEVAARRVRAGARYLVNPSSDDWIADPRFAAMMWDIVALRAVEQRRYLVRASTSGPSGIVDPWGRVQMRSTPFRRDVLLGSVDAREELSVYGRVGDLFGFACAALTAVALWVTRKRT